MHIINFVASTTAVSYGHTGPFGSLQEAGEWLEERGFYQHRPNLWIKEDASQLKFTGHDIIVLSLRAFVDEVLSVEKLNFRATISA